MKRLIISLAAAITAIAGMSASTAAPDSIIQIDNARRVTVTDIDGTVAISVECPDTTLTFTHAAARSHSVRSGSGLFSNLINLSKADTPAKAPNGYSAPYHWASQALPAHRSTSS